MDTIKIIFPIKGKTNPTEEEAVAAMQEGLKRLAVNGAISQKLEEVVKDYEIQQSSGYAIAVIDEKDLLDAAKLSEVGAGMSKVFQYQLEYADDKLQDQLKSLRFFSANTINERLRLMNADARMRMRYLVMDYRKYWKSNSNKFKDPKKATSLRNMFLTDMMGLFNDILPYVQEGKQLATLLGIATVTKDMNKLARDLSMSYKKALQAQASSGMISKNLFSKLKIDYNKFMTELVNQVMPGINDIILTGSNDASQLDEKQVEQSLVKSFSSNELAKVIVETTNPELLKSIIEAIKKHGNVGHSYDIVLDPNTDEKESFQWDGDGSDKINEITIIHSEQTEGDKKYSLCSDGRINLFS